MKLNIGGQKGRKKGNFKYWKIVDVRKGADILLDIMEQKLPLQTSSVEAVYTSHTLEHIFPEKLPFVLNEIQRVLLPGSPFRIVVPDIDIAIKAYAAGNHKFLRDKRNPSKMGMLPELPLCYLSSWFFTSRSHKELTGGHVMAFNMEVLSHYLKAAGFANIEQKRFNRCRDVFKGCDFDRYKDCSLYVESTG